MWRTIMGKKKGIHVVPDKSKGWRVKREGQDKPLSTHDKKDQAVSAGKDQAKKDKTELTIHNRDGKISDKDSYGNDPHPPKDKKH